MKGRQQSKEFDLDLARFRFLSREEFATLSMFERARYLQRAIEAIREGHPLDDLPIRVPD